MKFRGQQKQIPTFILCIYPFCKLLAQVATVAFFYFLLCPSSVYISWVMLVTCLHHLHNSHTFLVPSDCVRGGGFEGFFSTCRVLWDHQKKILQTCVAATLNFRWAIQSERCRHYCCCYLVTETDLLLYWKEPDTAETDEDLLHSVVKSDKPRGVHVCLTEWADRRQLLLFHLH